MTLYVDASAIVGMMTREEDDEALAEAMSHSRDRVFSAVTYWEAATAVARKRAVPLDAARRELDRFIEDFALRPVAIGVDEARVALSAWERYGKGKGHPARLNMGDCFAYASAKVSGASLLYKGDDFRHTDLA